MKTPVNSGRPDHKLKPDSLQPSAFSLRNQKGFSLIEMMIASLVGLILMAGTMQMFSSTKQSSRTNTAVTRMQENGRAALYFLENAVRLSGYRADSLVAPELAFPANRPGFNGQVINGVDNDSVGGNNILDGSDRILMRYRGNNDGVITDCVGNPFLTGQTVETEFRLTDAGELVCDPDMMDNPGNWQILIDGVEDMQILYGVDTDSDFNANYYVPANQIAGGSEVISVRISLLLQSDDLIATQPQAYRFNGVTVDDPGDRRLRKVFSSTIAVRNFVD